jgi:DNA-binding HxlR family transcriptional regulator
VTDITTSAPAETSGELVELLSAMREWAAGNDELHHHLGVRMRLPHTDSDAFSQIVWAAEAGDPLSPSTLSRRIGITSGATTALLRRLEGRALIERLRDQHDGRRVSLHPAPQGRDQLLAFVKENGTEIDQVPQSPNSSASWPQPEGASTVGSERSQALAPPCATCGNRTASPAIGRWLGMSTFDGPVRGQAFETPLCGVVLPSLRSRASWPRPPPTSTERSK